MNTLRVGVIGASRKEDERRFSIHPEHLSRIPEIFHQQLILEEGYVHCAQQKDITQAALDRKQSLIAFEDMFI